MDNTKENITENVIVKQEIPIEELEVEEILDLGVEIPEDEIIDEEV